MPFETTAYREALAHFKAGAFAKALPLLLELVKQGASHWQVLWRLAVSAEACGRFEEVAGEVREDLVELLGEARANRQEPLLRFKKFKHSDHSTDASLLREFAQRFEADVFVETGTYKGHTTAIAADIFRVVHTIELCPDLYRDAVQRFADRPHVVLHLGDSAQALPEILPAIEGRPVFWLDGHFSGGDTALGSVECPVMDELRAIEQAGLRDAIILVDDIRCFYPQYSLLPASEKYPSVAMIKAGVERIFDRPVFGLCGDAAMAFDASLGVGVSKLVQACSVSRAFEGAESCEAVMTAEEIISEAEGEERQHLLELAEDFAFQKRLTAHYLLWKGLITAVSGDPRAALQALQDARVMGLGHWRLKWYMAQTAHAMGDWDLASQMVIEVMGEAPAFAEATEFAETLVAAME